MGSDTCLLEERPVVYDPELASDTKNQTKVSSHGQHGVPCLDATCQLRQDFGLRFLIAIFTGQHLLRGFSEGLMAAATMYLFAEYNVKASHVNIFLTFIMLANPCKIIIGFLSDMCPLAGYRRMPLMVVTSVAGVVSCGQVFMLPRKALAIGMLVFLLFIVRLQNSTCDVLMEAQVSEKMRSTPKRNADILAFMSGGITFLSIVSAVSYGFITNDGQRDPRMAVGLCTLLAMPVLVTSYFNFHGETRVEHEEVTRLREYLFRKKEVVLLSLSACVAAVFLAIMQLVIKSMYGRLLISIGTVTALLVALNYTLNPDIARPATCYTIMIAFILDINGASFYFFTDAPHKYPEGPHFTPMFFNTVLSAVNGVFLLCGLAFYSRYMQNWTYRWQLTAAVGVTALLWLPDVVLFSRMNLRWGVPDHVFVVGTQALKALPETWDYIIVLALITKSCPPGMEATFFALLSSFASFGAQVNNYFGAFLLESLSIEPSGLPAESAQFNNLWLAALISSVFPLLCLPLIHCWIPDVKQSEDFVDQSQFPSSNIGATQFQYRRALSLTEGSLWARHRHSGEACCFGRS